MAVMTKKKLVALIVGGALFVGLAAYGFLASARLEPVTSLSVSSDGRYVISVHEDARMVLWDLEQRKREVLSKTANLYSAYFIENSDAFLWQDLDDVVHVQRVDGEVIEAFEHFPTYGHVMSHDREHYLSANRTWNIYHGHGAALRPVLRDSRSPSFTGTGQVLNLSIGGRYFVSGGSGSPGGELEDSPPVREEEEFRFSSSYGGVTLWSLDTLAPVAKLPGNSSKTYATISPDGQWVVSGDENNLGFFWKTDSPDEKYDMANYFVGLYLGEDPNSYDGLWDKSQLIEAPEGASAVTIALAFVNGSDEFLRLGTYSHYAALFEAGNPWPQKYFYLGDSPQPSVFDYSRNLSIDSAPEANLLVTGHAFGGGITVYRYDPEARTLTKEWVGR